MKKTDAPYRLVLTEPMQHVAPPMQPSLRYGTGQYEETVIPLCSLSKKSSVHYFQFSTAAETTFDYLPSGCITLLFDCSDHPERSLLLGSSLRRTLLHLNPHTRYLGVTMYSPFGLNRKINAFLRDTDNLRLPIADLAHADEIIEDLARATSFRQRITAFTNVARRYWLDYAYRQDVEEFCASMLCLSDGSISLDHLAGCTGYTVRTIQKKFSDIYGVAPKQYAMLKRYQKAVSLMVSTAKPLSFIATESNYFDQAHFTKDFKRFTDHTPEEYRALLYKTLALPHSPYAADRDAAVSDGSNGSP